MRTFAFASFRTLTQILACRRGNVVIETAFALPMLVVLAIGAADYGRAFGAKSELANVARTGAQAAMEFGGDEESLSSTVQSNLILAGLIPDPNSQNFDPTSQTQTTVRDYCTCPGGVPIACDDRCEADDLPRRYIEVTASLPYQMMTPIPVLGESMMLAETVSMRME